MSKNLETLMESRLLDDLPHDVTKALSAYICNQQTLKAPFIRNHGNLNALATKWSAWLEMQDIPTTIVSRTGPLPIKMAQNKPSSLPSGLSLPRNPDPITPIKTTAFSAVPHSPPTTNSPSVASLQRKPSAVKYSDDGVFTMDDDPPTQVVQSATDVSRPSPWKSKTTTEKVDMKAIIALAEEEQRSRIPTRRGDSDASDSSPHKWVVNRGQQPKEKGRPSGGPNIESSNLARCGSAENVVRDVVPSAPIKLQAAPSVSIHAVTRPSDSPWRPSELQARSQGPSGPPAFPTLSGKTPVSEQKKPNMNQAGSSQGPLLTPAKASSSGTVKQRASS